MINALPALVYLALRTPAECSNSGIFDAPCEPVFDPAPSGVTCPGAISAAGESSAGASGASDTSGSAGVVDCVVAGVPGVAVGVVAGVALEAVGTGAVGANGVAAVVVLPTGGAEAAGTVLAPATFAVPNKKR